ncbi:MAG: hypothetical protein ACKO2K_06995, partial [Alphaproteobacteria bacterium]
MKRKRFPSPAVPFLPLRPTAAAIAAAALVLLGTAAPARATVTRTVDCSNVTTEREYVWLDVNETLKVDFSNCPTWKVEDSEGDQVRSGTGPTGSEILDPGQYIRLRDGEVPIPNTILRVYFRTLYPEHVPNGTRLISDFVTLPASASEMNVGPENTGGQEENRHWLAGIPECTLEISPTSSAHVYSTYEVTVTVPGTYTFRGLSTDPPSNFVDYANAFNPIRDPYFALYKGFDPTKPDDNVIGCNDDLNDLFGYGDAGNMGEMLSGGSFMEGHLPYFVADLQPGTYQLVLMLWDELSSAGWAEYGPATVAVEMWGPTADLVDTDVEEPFAQINDQPIPNKDTWTVRGKVTDPTASTVVSDGVENGVTVTMYESAVPATPVAGISSLGEVDTFTFEPGDCRAIMGGRSLFCNDVETNSIFRARGVRSAKDPNSFRLNSIIRGQELTVTKPYELPLAYLVELDGRRWRGDTDVDYCRITQNG